ncbi:TPA: hypothetical protein TUF42_001829 [Streptococcus equi subsp. zooepidemicus]|nr:hypothetical protein [Streptococcus equi subsp. zooepidemicus]
MKEWIKDNMIYVIVVGLLLIFSGFAVYRNLTSSKPQEPKSEQTETTVEDDVSQSTPETVDEKNYRKAKLKLEHPYTEGSEEQKQEVAKSLDEAINSIKEAKHLTEVKGTIENHLSMSQDGMVQTLAMAILVNQYSYQASKLEVTSSENDDVVQFLIVLTKEGEDNCYFVGNFNTTVHQIQLISYIGGHIGGTFG